MLVRTVFCFCLAFSLNIADMINEPDKKKKKMECCVFFFFCLLFFPYLLDVYVKGTLKNILYSPRSTLGRKCTFLFLNYISFLASDLLPKDFQLKNQCVFCANHITNLNFKSINIVIFTMSNAI